MTIVHDYEKLRKFHEIVILQSLSKLCCKLWERVLAKEDDEVERGDYWTAQWIHDKYSTTFFPVPEDAEYGTLTPEQEEELFGQLEALTPEEKELVINIHSPRYIVPTREM